ncbi:MAG TPA: hypothetical protein PJ994_03000 [Tepidiformaceae bacterium]|nr:hypothetical protein [Tepidiformaceae bacterium]
MTYTPIEQANIDANREIVATGNAGDWDACYALVAPAEFIEDATTIVRFTRLANEEEK